MEFHVKESPKNEKRKLERSSNETTALLQCKRERMEKRYFNGPIQPPVGIYQYDSTVTTRSQIFSRKCTNGSRNAQDTPRSHISRTQGIRVPCNPLHLTHLAYIMIPRRSLLTERFPLKLEGDISVGGILCSIDATSCIFSMGTCDSKFAKLRQRCTQPRSLEYLMVKRKSTLYLVQPFNFRILYIRLLTIPGFVSTNPNIGGCFLPVHLFDIMDTPKRFPLKGG